MSGSLIRKARTSAGLTQRELADLLGTHQPVVARWETGRTRPDFDTVVEAVSACGFNLQIELTPIDHDAVLVRRELAKPPAKRLQDLAEAVAAFDDMAAAANG